MIIDIIFLALFIFALFKGLTKGLIVALFSFISFFVGLAAALKLSVLVTRYLGMHSNVGSKWLPFLAFIIVFIVVGLLIRIGAKIIEKLAGIVMLGWLNRIGGVLFYLGMYFFIYSILLFYGSQLHILTQDMIHSSKTFSIIEPIGPKMVGALGTIIPFFRNMFQQLLQFFQQVAEKNN